VLGEGIHLFKGAIGPFNLNGPSVPIGKHHVKDRLLRNFHHSHSIAINRDGNKTSISSLFILTAIINGILWRLRTGAPWHDVPKKYGKWNSIYRRFRRWSAYGVSERVAVALAETMAESGHYDTDSTTVRAHVSAAGGKGGFINEILAARGAGSPVKFIVSVMPEAGRLPSTSRPGEAADCISYDVLIDLPERAPGALLADEAYDSDEIRDHLKQRGMRAVIPPKSNRTSTIRYSKRLYRRRSSIERVPSPQDQPRHRHTI
jgi:transposase